MRLQSTAPRSAVVFRPFALAIILSGLILGSLATGAANVSLSGLFYGGEGGDLLIVSRLPRTLAAILAGSSLAVAGVIMQMLVRNRFVEPATTGTGECATLGLLAMTLLMPEAPILAKMAISSIAAFAGTAVFLALVQKLPPTQPLLVPLTGIVYGGIIAAITTFIAYQNDLLQYLAIWMNGEFSGVLQGRYELLWASGAVALVAYYYADQFTVAGFGKDAAIGLGLNYRVVLLIGLGIVSLITSFTVLTVGLLPFVGLVVPNIISRYRGDNARTTLPLVALMGGALVLASDLLGRLIHNPYEIPAGTIFGVLGTGVFLWLLFARPARRG
ncbi:MAG: iron chelate uptake ABC transporter family permease subunit [Roseibium sp.]|uniref:ABC transporter permease n=1 Tax=Roseibium sp. TaxID=1936156 RepID=UPI0026047DF8|nr:iron chelate uptake ABC transporter family permease subunit [Roseibium sp.]MCV0427856.1 iron chelate uptake ABC transporter family permease subunit [Roseibium sp.]